MTPAPADLDAYRAVGERRARDGAILSGLPDELRSVYVTGEDRFLVALVVGYTVEDLGAPDTQRAAASAAVRLVTGHGAEGTRWWVYDRLLGVGEFYRQDEVEAQTSTDLDALATTLTERAVTLDEMARESLVDEEPARLAAKASGVRLALSFVNEMRRSES